MKHGKKYQQAAKKIDAQKKYTITEAVDLLKQTTTTSFDSTLELHLSTGLNVKHADQMVRGQISLPAGTGKEKHIACFVSDDKIQDAKQAGADFVGGQELIDKILKENWMDFDVAIATPDMMKYLAKAAKVLGPRGLMPNPKSGTVTMDVVKAIKDIKGGKIEFKTDPLGNIHTIFGKASFSEADLVANLEALVGAIKSAKPSGAKGGYIKQVVATTTMGPAIHLQI